MLKKIEAEIIEKSMGEGQAKDKAMVIFKTHLCKQLCNRKTECKVLIGRNSPESHLSGGNLGVRTSLYSSGW